MSNLSKLVAEALGTFALCFIGGGAICLATLKGFAPGVDLLAIAMAHGLVLSIAVTATMNISGGHLNPAVTITMLLTKRIDPGLALQYIVSQLAGGAVAGILLLIIFGGMTVGVGELGTDVCKAAALGTPKYEESVGFARAILIEACLTFLLLFAIFGTAVDPRAPKIGGFGIGLAVGVDILVGGPLTGASMNPARTFGTGIVASISGNMDQFWSQHLVYWIGPVLGAILAGVVYDKFIMEKRRN